MFYLSLWSSWNWVSCGESWKYLLPIFLMFHRTDLGGFLVCCYKAIQQLNGVEKNYVAISLMLNHNLTGLWLGIRKMRARFVLRILLAFYVKKWLSHHWTWFVIYFFLFIRWRNLSPKDVPLIYEIRGRP